VHDPDQLLRGLAPAGAILCLHQVLADVVLDHFSDEPVQSPTAGSRLLEYRHGGCIPFENIWDYLRGNKLSKSVWDTYEAIVDACADAWMFLVKDLKHIDSIAYRSWACVNF
jgi:hypothetical protein